MDDVILKASLYGIHNPFNYHSFCNTALVTAPSLVVSSLNVFIPSPCVSCELIVMPFVNSCICLRCRCVAHRTCVRKVDSKCNAALFQGLESGAQGIDNGSVEKDLETIISKVCLIPKVLVTFLITRLFSSFYQSNIKCAYRIISLSRLRNSACGNL